MKSFKELMFNEEVEKECEECGKTPCECKKEAEKPVEESVKDDVKKMVKALKKEFGDVIEEDNMSDDEVASEVITYIANNPDIMADLFQQY